MGSPEEEEREKGAVRIFEEIITENVPNLVKNLKHPRRSVDSKYDEPKEIHTKTHHQTEKAKTKKKC